MAACVDVSSSVVFNSLLCFVRTKFKTLEMSRIKSTIVDFFSAEDICSAKRTLLESVSNLVMDKPLPRYPERQGSSRIVKETDDIMDILQQIDERKLLDALPKFVVDNSDSVPSPRMDEGELRMIMQKMSKLEAILFGVQTAVHNVQSTVTDIVRVVNHLSSTASALQSTPVVTSGTASTRVGSLNTLGNSVVVAAANVNNDDRQQQQSSSSNTQPKTLWSETLFYAEQPSASDTGSIVGESSDGFSYAESRKQRRKRRRRQQSEHQISQPSETGAAQQRTAPPSTSQVGQPQPATATSNRQRSNAFRQPLIVGKSSRVSSDSYNVTAARPYKSVYCIDNVDRSVSTDSLTRFVSSLGVRVLSCFEVKPRMSARQRLRGAQAIKKTFRLCINRADNKILLNAESWPSDVSIFRWFFKHASATDNNVRDPSMTERLDDVALHTGNTDASDVEDMDATVLHSYEEPSISENVTDTVN